MPWRFRKSIRFGKSFRVNLSQRGVGCSATIPGTGISWVVPPAGKRQGTSMRTVPTSPSICPDCKSIVPAQCERCQECGKLMLWVRGEDKPKPWWTTWVWPLIFLTMMALYASWSISTRPAPRVNANAGAAGGLSESLRRKIYVEAYHAGMLASETAEARYPHASMPIDQEALEQHLADRNALYERLKSDGLDDVMRRYKVNQAQINAIEQEGFREKWPLSEQ